MEFNQIYTAPSIPKLNKRNISSSIFSASKSPLATQVNAPKLKVSKFGFQKPSDKIKEKFEALTQSFQPKVAESDTPSNIKKTQEALVETNRILVEIQKQLSLDFAMRIAEEKDNLKKIKASEAKRRVFDKEKSIEGGARKLTEVGKNIVSKLTQPVKSIFDKIKEFFSLIVTRVLVDEAFKWLRDPNNRKLLDGIFYWIGKAFIPAVIAIIGYKVFKWVKRLWSIGRFLWKLPGRLIGILGKLLGALGIKGAPAAGSAAASAAVKTTTSSAYAATKAGKAYASMQEFKKLPKWAQKASSSSVDRFVKSNEKIIQGTANVGDKLRVGSRKFLPGLGGIAEGIGSGFKGLGSKIAGVGTSITEKFVAPIVNFALPKVPPKVRQKVAGAVASKGLKRFLPFVNTLFGTVEGSTRLLKGDIEGALISFASAIPIVGWGALALDIYRSVDPEGYKKNIRMGMTTEDMNAALSQGFGKVGSVGGFADGGTVPGRGSGKVDSVRAMLAPGEEVINTSSSMLFRPLLKDINDNSGRMWVTFSKAVGKLTATSEYQKDVSEEYSKVIEEFNENIKDSIKKKDNKKKPKKPKTTTPPPPSSPPAPTPTPAKTKPEEKKEDEKLKPLSGGAPSISQVKPKEEPGASVTPSAAASSRMVVPPESSGAGKMNFLNMTLPDAGTPPRIPQPPSQATDVSVISPVNLINPFMKVALDWYGIHVR